MKKATIFGSIPLLLSVSLVAFFVPFVSYAASVSSQLLNDTNFPVDTGVSTQEFVTSVGNIATGSVITGVQLQTASSNTDASNGFRIQLLEYPDEATFDSAPYTGFDAASVVATASNHTISADSSGLITTLWNGTTLTTKGFPYFYAISVDWINGAPPLSFSSLLGTNLSNGSLIFHRLNSTYSTTTNAQLYYQLYGGSSPDSFFTPAPGFAGFASSTVATTCDNSFATSSGFLDSVGSSISNGLCRVASFLFVPSPSSLRQFVSLASTSQQKIPFSYFYDIVNDFSSLSASSSVNVPTYTADLHGAGIGSTTPIGNILPSLEILSTTTINRYLPSGAHDALFLLARAAIWFGVGMFFYNKGKTLFKPTT